MNSISKRAGERLSHPDDLFVGACLALALLGLPSVASAAPYYDDGLGNGCVSCHDGFVGGPGAALHTRHTVEFNQNGGAGIQCNLCHPTGGGTKPVATYVSGAGGGYGCAGCHGRDYGETSPNSTQAKATAYGLRKVHVDAGVTDCGTGMCHAPGALGHPSPFPSIFPENVAPLYYDALFSNLTDPCSASEEDLAFDSDSEGLDNDGDGDKDYPADADCPMPTPTPPFACPAAPAGGCVVAGKGVLVISEKAPGKEKLKAVLAKLQSSVAASDFGDPVGGSQAYKLCVYDGASALAGEYTVDQGGVTCDGNPCFSPVGTKGFKYKDKALVADGVGKMNLFGGDAGKGKIVVVGKGKEGTMPTGAAAALVTPGGAIAQLLVEDEACFEATVSVVKKSDGTLFKAVTP